MTDLTKKQLTTILSALDDAPRNPANKGEALRAIGRSAARLDLTTDEVLAAAPGLLDGRISPEEFRAELTESVKVSACRRAGGSSESSPTLRVLSVLSEFVPFVPNENVSA